ncbi:MAG TPA: DUF692 domain-containing protein [Thermoanaerobaculia bacterium]
MPSAATETAPQVDRLASLPRLGAGLSYQGTLHDFVLAEAASFDFLEIIPDTFWVDRGQSAAERYAERVDAAPFLAEVRSRMPLVCHSVGLSIGSAEQFDTGHVRQIEAWQERYAFPWHSDHLSFNRLEHPTGHTIDVGFTMPVPYDEAVLAMLAERVEHVQSQVPVPFLLENNVYYFQIPDQEMSEPEFLNRLAARTGCGLLLDLHNVYVNSRNHGFAPWEFLGGLDLTRVVEIHLGGGLTMDGIYLDAHSGPAPDEVWKLLAEVLPEAPNVRGVVFEMFGNYFPTVGPDRLREELLKVRRAFDRV